MRKKYLSALLFGALLFASAGTFTSCKDYDDDINNLQSQIDKLATKEDMEAKLSQMQAAIDAAKATAEAAGNADEVKKLEDRIKALEDAAIDVDALKQEISASVDDQMDTFRTEMNALVEKVEGLVGQLADMVTSVELVYSSAVAEKTTQLSMMTVTEKDNVFGKGLAGEITFTKGTQKQTGDYVIVRVSPTNAVLTPAMYVTLDTRNAVESQPSEINAWNSYKYTGLNQVVEGTSTQITIDGANVINDIIGLRVYAVNQDGTLVDPDGRAFYVRLGAAAAEWNAVNTTITPDADITTLPTSEKSTVEAVTLTKLTGAVKAIWSPDKIGGVNSFDAMFVDKDGNILYNTANNDPSSIDFSKVTKIYTVPKIDDWAKYEDDKTYNGKLTIKNANDFVLATLDVSMTKVLPTTMPEGFSVKTAQVKDGIYNCYLVPTSWTGAQTPIANQQGTMDMNHVFNFGKGKESQYEISFAESKTENNKNVTNTVKGDDDLTIAIKYIDNTTKHATSIAYNYGNISSDPEKNNDGKGYKIVATSDKFETIYNCIYNNTYSWRWATREDLGSQYTAKDDKGNYKKAMPYSTSLTYGTDRYADGTNINYGQYIQGISTWDGLYSAKLDAPYQNSLIIKEAHLISNANKVVDEYFKVVVNSEGQIAQFKATQTSSETNPTAAVESTLQIIGYDMYGHKIVIELPMTVNRR